MLKLQCLSLLFLYIWAYDMKITYNRQNQTMLQEIRGKKNGDPKNGIKKMRAEGCLLTRKIFYHHEGWQLLSLSL